MPHDSQSENNKKLVALVDGDVTVDWHITTYRGPSESSLWHIQKEQVPFVMRNGGAALLGELIDRIAACTPDPKWHVVYRQELSDKDYPRLFTIWYEYESDKADKAWRISKFLGSDLPLNPTIQPLTATAPSLIIIDDKGHQFRQAETWWKNTIEQANENTWFLVRTGRPLKDEGVWPELRKRSAKVIAVTTVDDIRQEEVLVSRRLSWELTAQDLYNEILENHDTALPQLRGCDFIVVCFTASAVVVIENAQRTSNAAAQGQSEHCWLIYDPSSLEDEEWRDTEKGTIHGYTYCVIAAIAHYLFPRLPDEQPEAGGMSNAIMKGLTASRNLYKKGYTSEKGAISFPFDRVVKDVTDDAEDAWGVVHVPPRNSEQHWTLFENQAKQYGGLEALARRIVREGLDEFLRKLPFYKVGDLVVADRREIESFRSIQRLLKEYAVPKPGVARPLSIAVFGPPGCGKSFGIEQLAKSEIKGIDFAPLTCNLSQLTKADDLHGAFHQIRDKSLSGKLPLVFWDEFDCSFNGEDLGWLRFFLVPMQDGRFRESQIEHFIGRAIFVFAGGTKPTLEDFYSDLIGEDKEALALARNRKVPDFISRLQGYLNVLGLNPSPSKDKDPLYVVRRAIVLRSQLRKHEQLITRKDDGKTIIDIDAGVLNALLHIKEYKHGVRSMEGAISMSILSDRNRFERSSLPLEAQLNLHVNGKEFISLLMSNREADRLV